MEHDIMEIVNRHEEWRFYNCINLIPSENVTSPQVRALLSSDMGHRYTLPMGADVHGVSVENCYRGTKYTDEIEDVCRQLACRVFGAKFACVKPLSGHTASMIALLSTMKRGDLLLTLDSKSGGYDGYGAGYLPDILGMKAGILPFDAKTWQLDDKKSADMIKKKKPKAVVIGTSFIMFPFSIDALKPACKSAGGKLLYDASHVLGLIAGDEFQPNPLLNGVDLMFGSTHKSFFGPQGGIMLTNSEEIYKRIEGNITWRTMDNAHWNRIAALAQALSEMERFGAAYARQVVENAKALGKGLHERGFPMKFGGLGFTRSHQLAIDTPKIYSRYGLEPNELAALLERSNIITDAVGRLGTCEATRIGMKKDDMDILAGIMVKAVRDKADVTEEVRILRRNFELEYCLK